MEIRDCGGAFCGVDHLAGGTPTLERSVVDGPDSLELLRAFVNDEPLVFSIDPAGELGFDSVQVVSWFNAKPLSGRWAIEFIFIFEGTKKPYRGKMEYSPYDKTGKLIY